MLVGRDPHGRSFAPRSHSSQGRPSSSARRETSRGGSIVSAASTSLVCPIVTGFFEQRTCSVQYIVTDPATRRCAVIDPVLDFDLNSGATATRSADQLLAHIEREDCTLEWILDTHP